MCGIAGIYYKNEALSNNLGTSLAAMLIELSDRGPDSAGVAIYQEPNNSETFKVSLFSPDDFAWDTIASGLKNKINQAVEFTTHATHALFEIPKSDFDVISWLEMNHPDIRIMSAGNAIEIYKDKGLPREFVDNFALGNFSGSHALGHTRMATESAVTTEHSHPFSTGMDLCLVHNGSLSNHNRLRRQLRSYGVKIQTDNDSEVAAGYLMWRLREGDTLEQALHNALDDLDGFYTLAIGTRDGFAVLRDPIACKPAVLAETDDWVAMASEFRAIAQLDGVENAKIWEPAPATVYTWGAA